MIPVCVLGGGDFDPADERGITEELTKVTWAEHWAHRIPVAPPSVKQYTLARRDALSGRRMTPKNLTWLP